MLGKLTKAGNAVGRFAQDNAGSITDGISGGIGGALSENVNIIRDTTNMVSNAINAVTDPVTSRLKSVLGAGLNKIMSFAGKGKI